MGFIRQGSLTYGARTSSYRASVNATDTGTTPAGVQKVTANVSNITTGERAIELTADSHTIDPATSYGWRSDPLTPNTTLAEGTKSWTITPTDGAGNAPATPFNGTAPTVDNAAPVTTQIAATNAGGTANRPDLGDQVVFTTGQTGATGTADLLNPYTILPNWSGETTVQGVIDGNASPRASPSATSPLRPRTWRRSAQSRT